MNAPRTIVAALLALSLVRAFAPVPARAQAIAESIGDRMVRFHADAAARDAALPSLALQRAFPATGEAPAAFPVRPRFERRMGGQVVRIEIERGTSLYGAGESAGPLQLNGRQVIGWNTDAYGYRDASLYQTHPWVLAVREDGSAFGVLADTPNRLMMDFATGIEFRAQGPAFPVIVIDRESPQAVSRALGELVGTMPLPPKWALGFQQCRFSYWPDSEVVRVARTFREKRIPCDVLWYDIDYMDEFRSFTWHPRGFSDPVALHRELAAQGFHTVAILDPGLKKDAGYFAYEQGTKGDHWVKTASGEPYVGKVWPGECVFPDFTRAATRRWWAGLVAEFMAGRLDGLWNDMNEPAVFETPTKTMPETNRHDADPELGGPGYHSRYHNVYGALMARASRDGALLAHPDRRPFVLSRAGYLGSHRWAATWTGDNRATWEHLRLSVPMTLSLGLSGQPFAGPDLGGFIGSPDAVLFSRWIGVGALFPFARGHSEKGSARREPWSFGPAVEATGRRAIETRYRLMPYLYTLFEEAARTGLPVMRPTFFADPRDLTLRAEQQSFLLGADLLVQARLDETSPGLASTPGERLSKKGAPWRRANVLGTPDAATDPDLPSLYVRPGAVIPLGPVMQHVDAAPLEDVTLLVSLDANGRAEGTLYEDAGDGFGYQKGEFLRSRIEVERKGKDVSVRVTATEGRWKPPGARRYTAVVLE